MNVLKPWTEIQLANTSIFFLLSFFFFLSGLLGTSCAVFCTQEETVHAEQWVTQYLHISRKASSHPVVFQAAQYF